MHLRWQDIRRHRDDTHASQCADGESLIVIAGPDIKILWAEVQGSLEIAEITAGLFGTHDVRVFRQFRIALRCNIDSGTGGHVIKNDGHIHRISNAGIVPNESRLAGFVVIWCHQQQAISSGPLCILGQSQSRFCIIGAGSGNYRNPAINMLHTEFNGPHPLTIGHGAGLSCCAADDDCVCSALQLEVQKAAHRGQIYAFMNEWRHNRHTGTFKNWLFHTSSTPS